MYMIHADRNAPQQTEIKEERPDINFHGVCG